MKSMSKGISANRLRVMSMVISVVIWEVIADLVVKNKFILPGFSDVVRAFIFLVERGTLLPDVGTSLLHFGIGLLAALAVGIPIGIAMGWFTSVDSFIDPLIEILRPIPPLAWIPFAIVWFGLTHQSAGFIIFVGAVFPILINTYTGLRGVPRLFIEAAKVLGCTNDRDLIRYIALPAALPSIAAGIRIATGVGWMCLVAAELFGVSKYGLGQKMWFYYYLHQMDNVVVYMAILGLIGLFIDMTFRYYIERRVLKWRKGEVV